MISPPAMYIETAADGLKDLPSWLRADQLKELHSFGDNRAQAIGAGGLSIDFEVGYELGLQVARTILLQSSVLALARIDPKGLL